jgi:hypothetical protein
MDVDLCGTFSLKIVINSYHRLGMKHLI